MCRSTDQAHAVCALPQQHVQSWRVHVGKYSCVSFDKALNQNLEYTQIPIIRVDIKRKMLKKILLFVAVVWWCVCKAVIVLMQLDHLQDLFFFLSFLLIFQ